MQIDGGTVFHATESNNAFGWDAGGGLMGFFGSHVGLRGDVRYFRVFNGPLINNLNLGGLNFWRVSAGLVFR